MLPPLPLDATAATKQQQQQQQQQQQRQQQQVWQRELDIQKIVDFASMQGCGNSSSRGSSSGIRGGGDLRPQ